MNSEQPESARPGESSGAQTAAAADDTAEATATATAVATATATAADGPGDPAPRRKTWVRIVAWLAVLLTAWHILASFLWIAPYSSSAREVVPGNTLSKYMLPFFGQSWSVFAPEPINGDYHFNVRAIVPGADGKDTTTGWVSATDVEISMIRYNLAPPRAGIQSNELASAYKDSFDGLTDREKAIVRGDFTASNWEVGLEAALAAKPGAAPAADSGKSTRQSPAAKRTELAAQEHRSTAYATQVARAIWGEDVKRVQYRVSRQNVVPFEKRHDPDAKRPDPVVVLPGWRAPVVEQGQNDENFRKTFVRAYERMSK
ncbi:DUF5819 family protein [Brevibacterium sp. 50QC2O2]|uniref:DUF5819 family protein n=1 Tax=Brevibacterium TaxID=1696 RepID=UPI00211B8F3B|nr:DUF5819 family protein [Brevibacterium sp. 91QC2O2]MCQ9385614.1 DUF5819 family protein [Brevibacterium sp. 68QC2CO]MCQ9389876.1 DUF5819 family protein [Brevibacterium sp. 50QC2O2]